MSGPNRAIASVLAEITPAPSSTSLALIPIVNIGFFLVGFGDAEYAKPVKAWASRREKGPRRIASGPSHRCVESAPRRAGARAVVLCAA